MGLKESLLRARRTFKRALNFINLGGVMFAVGRNRVVSNQAFIKDAEVHFFVSSVSSLRRVKQAHLKEPMTQRWIDNMNAADCLWDVGANVGIFTLRAASRGVKVVAIEPLIENLVELHKSLDQNSGVSSLVIPVLAGLSNRSGPVSLFSPSVEAGYSGAQLGNAGDEYGRPFTSPVSRQVMALEGDELLYLLERDSNASFFPTHIKIDVDGIELDCLRGLSRILTSGQVKSILVETGPSQWGSADHIDAFLAGLNFTEVEREPTTPQGVVLYNKIYQYQQ